MKNIVHSLRLKGFQVHVQHFRPILFPDGTVRLAQYSRHIKTNGQVLSTGGFTRLTISHDGSQVGSAVAQCSKKDPFSYKEGVREAYLKLRPAIELAQQGVL